MNDFNPTEYKRLVAQKGKKSPLLKNCICAFLIGGAICAIGEGLRMLYTHLGAREEIAPTLVSVTLIFLTAALTALGFDKLPICMAKTQYSFSDDPLKLGAPDGFTVSIKNVKVSAGAGFVVVLTGDIMTMPGLPKTPAAEKIDVDDDGKITGLF